MDKCVACGKEVSFGLVMIKGRVHCRECNALISPSLPGETNSELKRPFERDLSGRETGIMLGIICFLFFGFLLYFQADHRKSEKMLVQNILAAQQLAKLRPPTQPPVPQAPPANLSGAWVMAQEFVLKSLKSPSTAKFPFSRSSEGVNISTLGNKRYSVSGWVDAQNSYGAVVRTKWNCTVVDKGDTWGLEGVVNLQN